jgi:protoheme IX farnesyltransferase
MATVVPPVGPPSASGAAERTGAGDWWALAKPGITALIVLVAVGGFLIARPGSIALLPLLWLVVTGAAASAGSAMLNHYLDRDVDARMRRTKDRPIPARRLGSEASPAIVGLVLLGGGVAAASLLLNPLTGFSIFLGGATYVLVYTVWLKRRSSWNIVIGGFAGSAPVLAGSAAATGTWTTGALALALLVFLWTPPHFWSLALLLRDDYARAGLPMLPKMDDPAFSGKVVVVSAALLVPAGALLLGSVSWPATLAVIALGLVYVALTLPLWWSVERPKAVRGFVFSGPYLLAVVGAVALNVLLVRVGVPVGW